MSGQPTRDDRTHEAWFRERPRLAAVVAVGLFAAVYGLREVIDGADEAISVLYVLPVALVAFAFGRRAGVVAGAVGFGLFAVWALTNDASLTLVGWLSRAVPMLLLGALVGGAADQQRAAAMLQQRVLEVELRAQEAAEINDSIIQGLAVAKWSLESGSYDRSLEVLTETMDTAQAVVADLLADRPIRPGSLRRREPALHVET